MGADLQLNDYFQFIAALLAVIGLIAGLGWVAKKLNLPERMMQARPGKRLRVVEQLAIDNQSRLAIVACDGREHLLLIQRQGSVLVDGNLPASIDRQDPNTDRSLKGNGLSADLDRRSIVGGGTAS